MSNETRRNSGRPDLLSKIVKARFAELKGSHSFLPVVVLLVAAVFFIQDIYIDIIVEHKSLSHVTVEGGIFLAVLLALGNEVKRFMDLYSSVAVNQKEIMLLKGRLAHAISDEFDQWHLTGSEKEIALFLIKGLSMQEIAELRGVKEKSIRQQATRIYTKAGVSNRHELAAYFIEDLLISDHVPA